MSLRPKPKRGGLIGVALLVGLAGLLMLSSDIGNRSTGGKDASPVLHFSRVVDEPKEESGIRASREKAPTEQLDTRISSWLSLQRGEVGVVTLSAEVLSREFGNHGELSPVSNHPNSCFVRLLNRELSVAKLQKLLGPEGGQNLKMSVIETDGGQVSLVDFDLSFSRPDENGHVVDIEMLRKNASNTIQSRIEAEDGCYLVVSTGDQGDPGVLVFIGSDSH